MREQIARVNQIELGGRIELADIHVAELDVAQAGQRRRRAAASASLNVIQVRTDHVAIHADAARELERDITAAAANVQTAHARTHADPIEQGRRCGMHDARQDLQPVEALDAAADDIGFACHRPDAGP